MPAHQAGTLCVTAGYASDRNQLDEISLLRRQQFEEAPHEGVCLDVDSMAVYRAVNSRQSSSHGPWRAVTRTARTVLRCRIANPADDR